jgi:hypothetical protein
MKKNKRDNAKTPTNNKTQPHTPKKNIEHARARAQEEICWSTISHNLSRKNYPKNSITKKHSITGKLENKHQPNSKQGSKQSKKNKLKTL